MIDQSGIWPHGLRTDPLPVLLEWQDQALTYLIRRDLLKEQVPAIEALWNLPKASKIIRKQLPDGSWKFPGKTIDPETGQNYFLLETYRNLRVLVDVFCFSHAHPAIQRSAEYIFSCQTEEKDIRGILGNQYMPYYHGAILELLVKAGYAQDPHVLDGLDWLLSMRQEDGGWIIPALAIPPIQRTPEFWSGEPAAPDRSKPFAHLATGMILPAFAVHPDYRDRPEIIAAGTCLKHRFFQADRYNDRKDPSYWLKFQFPYWWSNLLTDLDALSRLGFDHHDPDIAGALDWFLQHQEDNGLWNTGYGSGKEAEANRHWVGFAVCRMLNHYYNGD